MKNRIEQLEKALADAYALLSEVIDGDQLYDPGCDEEQESRDELKATWDEVKATSEYLLRPMGEHQRYAVKDEADGFTLPEKYREMKSAQGAVEALNKALGGQWVVEDTEA